MKVSAVLSRTHRAGLSSMDMELEVSELRVLGGSSPMCRRTVCSGVGARCILSLT